MTDPCFTIGHSNRSLVEFLELLEENGISQVVDVCRLPGSARNPHFDADALEESLAEKGILLRRLDPLTGRCPASRTVAYQVNGWWQNRSFHNYADHALSAEFAEGLATLREWAALRRTARHILGPRHVDAAELSAGARMGDDLRVTYPIE